MRCQDETCSDDANWVCMLHSKKLCEPHYNNHSFYCKYNSISIEVANKTISNQIKALNRKVSLIEGQLVNDSNQIISSLQRSLKNSVQLLKQQSESLILIIRMGKPEDQINEYLKLIPDSIQLDQQNLYQSLLDVENKLNFEDFYTQLNSLWQYFMPSIQLEPENSIPVISQESIPIESKDFDQNSDLLLFETLRQEPIANSKINRVAVDNCFDILIPEWSLTTSAINPEISSNSESLRFVEYPVQQHSAKNNLKDMIKWCKEQGLLLISSDYITEANLSRDSRFVFICIAKIVCKIHQGKLNKSKYRILR